MNRINEFNLEPGTYQHYKGGLYVVTDIITHMDPPDGKGMAQLADPLVCYRDLVPIERHVNGKVQKAAHQVYARPLSEFVGTVENYFPTTGGTGKDGAIQAGDILKITGSQTKRFVKI